MRTALILLLLLALAAVAGSLLPQVPNSPERAAQYLLDHPFWGEFFLRAGFFDVFGSWWFTLITVLLFTSLVACLLPRTRAHVRAIRQRPMHAREIDAFPLYRELAVEGSPDAVAVAAERVLRRRRFRVARAPDRPAVAAEKGALREAGSLLFHWAFLLLLVGVLVGKGTGYTGRAVVVEGTTWTDAQPNYDGRIRAGRFFSGGFTGMQIRLIDFQDEYRTSGVPMDFVSHVDFIDADGNPIRSDDIRVNHPASVEGLRIFQYGFGWAPAIEVRGRDGQVLQSDDPIPMVQDQAPDGVSQLAVPWHGFVKVPLLRPQVAIELELWPDGRAFFQSLETGEPQPMVEAVDPLLRYRVWRGRLTDLSLTSLDTAFMRQGASGFLGRGQTVDLERGCLVSGPGLGDDNGEGADRSGCPKGPVGMRMSFPELRQYSVLQVSRDAGVPLVLGAAILILVGLLPALYTSRRKVWVRVDPAGEGSVLKVGGFALQRKGQFDEEFAKLVAALVAAAGGERREEASVRPTQPNERPRGEPVAP